MKRFLLLICWWFISCSISSSSWWWYGGRSAATVSADPYISLQNDVVLPLLGVAPQDEEYYYNGGWSSSSSSGNGKLKLKCKDGSNSFTSIQFNDDFCDCLDASDEPGTSACPNGKFYCKNAGHVPLSIYSSRVNDGICDCCDGSDEYDGKVKCPNTCWEAGNEAREKLKRKIATYREGTTIRKREVEQAKLAIEKEEAELSKLKNEEKILKGLVEQLKERKEQIERAEEKERLQKEKEEREKSKAEEANPMDDADAPEGEPTKKDIHDKVDVLEDVVDDHENSLGKVEHTDVETNEGPSGDAVEQVSKEGGVEHVKAEIENTESLSREELGRRVASRWTGEKTEEETNEVGDTATSIDNEYLEDDRDEEYNNYGSDDDEHKYDDVDNSEEDQTEEDFVEEDHHDDSTSSYKYESDAEEESDLSDITSSSNPSWLEKIQKSVRRILQAVTFFQEPMDKSEAAHILKEYDESSDKLSKIRSRISSLTKKLKHDFGPEKEFYSFYGRCFESKQNKYVYKICAFKEASQTESYSTTRLGNWDKLEDSYRTMQFSNGDKCWNGPDRSLKVKLRCGLTNEVSDVDEPSRCEYLAFLSAPALCHEEKLKELQDKLDTMNKELPRGHDEL